MSLTSHGSSSPSILPFPHIHQPWPVRISPPSFSRITEREDIFGNNFLYENLEFLLGLAWSGLDQCKYSRSRWGGKASVGEDGDTAGG